MNQKKTLIGIALLILLFASLGVLFFYKNREAVGESDVTFTITTDAGKEIRLHMWHSPYDDRRYLFLPSCASNAFDVRITASGLHLVSFDGGGRGLSVDASGLTEGEHTVSAGGSNFPFTILCSSEVASLYVTTDSGSLSYIEEKKGNSETGLYTMIGEGGRLIGAGTLDGLKSRGNVTFLEDKKPYQMTVRDEADLFGGDVPIQNYILLANRQDQSLLRNKILYDLAADCGLPFTPRSRFVDLYINEEYRGSYLLCEKAEVAKNRVPIKASGKVTETGFFVSLEYPDRLDEADEEHGYTRGGQALIVKNPKKLTDAQMSYIIGRFEEIENALADDSLESLNVDWDSFAGKYLMEEFSKNLDAMYSSQNFYCEAKDAKGGILHEAGRLYAGPVWDYDKTLGNPLIEHSRPVNFQEPWGIYAASAQKDANWWHDLMGSAFFQGKVRDCLEDRLKDPAKKMIESGLDKLQAMLSASASLDYVRWDPFEHAKYDEPFAFEDDYRGEVERIRSFMEQRLFFLDKALFGQVRYDELPIDPQGGELGQKTLPALEGYPMHEIRHPKLEGKEFDHWERSDNGEPVDFDEPYDGMPFTLRAVYR
ncbi:MAG: CotH kinase family protein [Lachnospiraceae bacterium]|nr:CotH kinase family protein [Lachnospiraceae bacterium]